LTLDYQKKAAAGQNSATPSAAGAPGPPSQGSGTGTQPRFELAGTGSAFGFHPGAQLGAGTVAPGSFIYEIAAV